jgi:hypothetical protein
MGPGPPLGDAVSPRASSAVNGRFRAHGVRGLLRGHCIPPGQHGGRNVMPAQWQISFDHGHQQRYLPDRHAVLTYVLAIGPKAASQRFEVFTETAAVRLADGSPGGRAFSLVEVIDLARPGEAERLRAELAALSTPPAPSERSAPAAPSAPSAPSPPSVPGGQS